jgi:hypothetical protein
MRFAILYFGLGLAAGVAQNGAHPNYDDDVKPIFARRCFGCHNAAEMRAGLSLESVAGVLKGGGSGEIAISGRPGSSLLYKVVAREAGVPQMPFGGPKLPDAEIATIHDWLQLGMPENAASRVKPSSGPPVEYAAGNLNRPAGPPSMPVSLPVTAEPAPAHANPITALAASPWAPLAAIAGHDRIRLFDLAKRTSVGDLAFPEGIPYVLHFSRNGATLLAGGGRGVQSGKVVLFDVKTGKRLAVVGDEPDIVLAADISADGKLVALGGPKKVVKVYSVPEGKLLYQIGKHTDWITALEFSPDGARLATGDRAGGIALWDSHTGSPLGALEEHKGSITSLSWRGDSRLLASASEDGQIVIWNVDDGFPMATIAKAHQPKAVPGVFGTPPGGVLGVQFTSDGRLVSVGRDAAIRIWGADGKPRGASQPGAALLTKVAASFDGKLVLAGDYEGQVEVWDGKQLTKLELYSK